ncbi:MAG: Glu/Leu/Phe/Val dehydrogenase [Hyphomicrobiales bacterium]|nr:Glu/Leu/Phe/Val dehydrogenase [Hyphomicrobiales bacterium]MCP4998673.1 Glu/Leu/Phe/Val dehydrogenase [Hyphomicrobiales bacterium]
MIEDVFRFSDDIGPAKILHVYNPALGLRGIVVVDNIAAGPAIGGTRMEPDVTLEECVRLARAMTLKNAASGLPHGGAKSVIFGDPAMPVEQKEQLIRAFAQAIRNVESYIPGPDMGTNEQAMAWIKDEIGRSVGLPRQIGGIPLDEIGATGYGLAVAAEVAQDYCELRLRGARIVVQGFGSVGMHVVQFLSERGATLVGASDSRSAIVNPDGLDVAALIEHKCDRKPVGAFDGGNPLDGNDVIGVPCDIWIPAARPDIINENNVDRLDCKVVLQGANIPATPGAEAILHKNGVLVVPDFIANSGGVICGSIEYHGGTQSAALLAIEEKVHVNTHRMLRAAAENRITPRAAAMEMAETSLRKAMSWQRWHRAG